MLIFSFKISSVDFQHCERVFALLRSYIHFSLYHVASVVAVVVNDALFCG